MISYVDAIEKRLKQIQKERESSGDLITLKEPPLPPSEWSWEHIDVEARDGVIAASVGSMYSGGCRNCYRYWDRGRGYVEVYIDGEHGQSRAFSECPQCRTLRKRVNSITAARLPSKFEGKRFEWKDVSVSGASGDSVRQAFDSWVESVSEWVGECEGSEPPSIALLGPTGRGKSHAAFMIAKFAIREGVSVRWVEWSSMLNEIMSKQKTQRAAFDDALIDPGVVIVDDIGVGNHSGWARDIACSFLEQIPRKTVCVFTSNGIPDDDGPNGLDAMIGDRASSRLSGVCGRGSAFFVFSGNDWRKGFK